MNMPPIGELREIFEKLKSGDISWFKTAFSSGKLAWLKDKLPGGGYEELGQKIEAGDINHVKSTLGNLDLPGVDLFKGLGGAATGAAGAAAGAVGGAAKAATGALGGATKAATGAVGNAAGSVRANVPNVPTIKKKNPLVFALPILAAVAALGIGLTQCNKDKKDPVATDAVVTSDVAETEAAASEAAVETEAAAVETEAAVVETEAATVTEAAAAVTEAAGGVTPPAGGGLIGLVTDVGKVDDKSFNQSAWEGAQAAAKELGMTSEYIESNDQKDYASNIQQLIDKGAKIVVTVGFAMGEDTVKAATANPGVKFIGVDQFQGAETANVAGLIFPEDQAGYMAGALAGLMTKTNKIAAVLGTDTVPPVKKFGEGFRNGVKAMKPDAEVIVTYHEPNNAFGDPAWGATTAKQALDNGADIVFGAGGATGNGALAEVAKKEGALCIGVDTDQYNTVPEAQKCLLTSAMKNINEGVITLAKQAADGSMKGGNFTGTVGLAPYHDTDALVSAEVKTQIETIIADVKSGKIDPGVKL
jgi:basic membrane protein A and related proteins